MDVRQAVRAIIRTKQVQTIATQAGGSKSQTQERRTRRIQTQIRKSQNSLHYELSVIGVQRSSLLVNPRLGEQGRPPVIEVVFGQ